MQSSTLYFSRSGFSSSHKEVKLEDAVGSGYFYPKKLEEIRSMLDGEHYTTLEKGTDIVRYNYATGKAEDVLFSLKDHQKEIYNISNYEFNSDETKILITSNEEKLYRHSFLAEFYVYDIKQKTLIPVSKNGKQQLATFSPIGDKVAFVRKNNIFIVDFIKNQETQITIDGKHNEIINGAPDWVYEEEFSFNKGFEWSPDGLKLAYMRFDESNVRMFSIPVYDELYPTIDTYKYPKAGEQNSVVSIHVYDLISGKNQLMDVGDEKNQYIPRIMWANNPDMLGILRLNRLQNKIDLLMADANTGKSEIAFSEKNKKFISEVKDQTFTFLKDGKHMIVFSERSGFNHMYLYTLEGDLLNQITKGNFDVDELQGVNQSEGVLYYTSTEISPLDRNVYSIKLDGTEKKLLTAQKGTNSAAFSKTYKYFINTWSDANTPAKITLNDSEGKLIRVLEENAELQKRMVAYGFGKKEFMTIPTANDLQLNAYIIKPLDFDAGKRYPVFVYVYGGPGSQEVTNDWDSGMGWFQMIVQQGYLVVCIDNRGTDGRGEDFKKCTYLQLGKLETEDQINAAHYLAKLPYVDGSRIGIFGWSYGGYMTSLCVTKGAGIFKMGIAVAPVTNWRFYDSIYTERFMRTPQENPEGYDDNSPMNFADQLKDKFLLIHGSSDDNVHLQNTMVFAKKLVQANKPFELFIYPDNAHNMASARLHLYQKMTDFVLNNL